MRTSDAVPDRTWQLRVAPPQDAQKQQKRQQSSLQLLAGHDGTCEGQSEQEGDREQDAKHPQSRGKPPPPDEERHLGLRVRKIA
jgi:hypothetical protein